VNRTGCADHAAIVLSGVTFTSGTADLTRDAQQSLTATAAVLKQSAPGQKFEVAGYTDNIGDPNLNLQISKQRAEAVRSFLIRQGISEALLISKGYGPEDPIADNATPAGRAENRRVELRPYTK
jgi:outer membrane protein OmpA-like peptidoglycan-associated protein